MPQFKYKAINKKGDVSEGIRAATDKFTLLHTFKDEGFWVQCLTELKPSHKNSFAKFKAMFERVRDEDKILFARNLGSMLDAGLPLSRALSVFRRESSNSVFSAILQNIENAVSKGASFSSALSAYPDTFPDFFVAMVKSGEESGSLGGSLSSVASELEKARQIRSKVKGAMIYPAVILSIMVGVGIIMLVFVVPGLTKTFADLHVELPWTTSLIVGTTTALKDHFILIVSVLVILAAGFYELRKLSAGKRALEYVILRTPIVKNISKEVNVARTYRTLSSLLGSGVDFLEAMRITRRVVQNSYYRDVLKKAEKNIETGENISDVFAGHPDLYPIFVSEMMSIGEETGKLSHMLEEVATYYEAQVSEKMKNISVLIEPVLMVFIGLAVGFFAVAMISPTYSIMSNM